MAEWSSASPPAWPEARRADDAREKAFAAQYLLAQREPAAAAVYMPVPRRRRPRARCSRAAISPRKTTAII